MAQLGNEIILALEDHPEPITAKQVLDYCPSADSLSTVKASLKYRVKTGLVEEILEHGFSPKYRLIKTDVENDDVEDPAPKKVLACGLKRLVPPMAIEKTFSTEVHESDRPKVLADYVEAAAQQDLVNPDKSNEFLAKHAFLQRSLDQSQQLLDEYLASVIDPAIYEPLKGIRDLAILQLEQLVGPAENEDERTGIIRSGTG